MFKLQKSKDGKAFRAARDEGHGTYTVTMPTTYRLEAEAWAEMLSRKNGYVVAARVYKTNEISVLRPDKFEWA